jgi:SAM-dependent methyltransferase
MGDQNQLLYLQRFAPKTEGAILEIGSKDYGSTVPFRRHIGHREYVGLDMAPGPGVDVVGDLSRGLCGLPENHFSLVICCSVLEHVERPWLMAENITCLVRPGGLLYMSVPWVWRYHAYPDDYFRFSWRGIETLFPAFAWRDRYYSTTVTGEFFEITEESKDADNRMATLLRVTPAQNRKYLPYFMVNMLGAKREAVPSRETV